MGGKTDLRWSDEEWAALERWATRRGVSPGRAAKLIVAGQLWKGRGPAAPEVRESAGAGGGVGDDRRGVGPVGSASSRPAGSAGSVGPVPPAGGGAASVVEPPPAADAPTSEGVALLAAVAAALRAQGQSIGVELQARRAIVAGKVVVDGEVCTDPSRLVDPAELA